MANQGNGGLYSKFQQRLRNIRLSRSKKKRFEQENKKYIEEKVQEIRTVVSKEPIRISRRVGVEELKQDVKVKSSEVKDFHSVSSSKNSGVETRKDVVFPEKKIYVSPSVLEYVHTNKPVFSKSRKVGISLKEEGNELKQSNEIFLSNQLGSKENIEQHQSFHQEMVSSEKVNLDNRNKEEKKKDDKKYSYKKSKLRVRPGLDDMEKKDQIEELGVQIINKIKTNFEDKLDELDVLMSELYFLEKTQENEVEMRRVKEIKKKIYELINRINEIIDQYNLYKKNYYMDNFVGMDDNELIDDLIDYRTLLDSSSDEKRFVREYKALEEFQQLYMNLKVIREETISLCEKNEEKIEEFDVRDKKYHEIQLGMIDVQQVLKNCSEEIERQNQYYTDLMGKIEKIDRIEYATYRLKGFQDLVGQSLRYMGLMLLSPLRGMLPGIATQTLATRRLIGNLYQNLEIEKVEHVRYEAINYDIELGHKLTDIGYTSVMIEDTLQDIEHLKEDFMFQYDSRIPGYEDTLKKIDQIQRQVVRSQERVEKIRMRLKKSKKLNEKKLVRVKVLNENASRS